MSEYIVINKAIIAAICLLETIGFCYTPLILSIYLSKFRNKYINSKTLNNATSGAILSLSLTHLIPEGFTNNIIVSDSIDITGFISMAPIIILISIDFLLGNPCVSDLQAPINKIASISEDSTLDDNDRISTPDFHLDNSIIVKFDRCEINRNNNNIFINMLKSPSFYMLITLISHSILEGMLLGSKSGTSLWAMAFGIIAHKWAECFIMINILDNVNNLIKHISIIAFCLAVPIGVLTGHFITINNHTWEIVFGQLAAGFFIYLSFELLMSNSEYNKKNRLITWISYMIGVISMSVIMTMATIIEKRSE